MNIAERRTDWCMRQAVDEIDASYLSGAINRGEALRAMLDRMVPNHVVNRVLFPDFGVRPEDFADGQTP